MTTMQKRLDKAVDKFQEFKTDNNAFLLVIEVRDAWTRGFIDDIALDSMLGPVINHVPGLFLLEDVILLWRNGFVKREHFVGVLNGTVEYMANHVI